MKMIKLGCWFNLEYKGEKYSCNLYRELDFVSYHYCASITKEVSYKIFGRTFKRKKVIFNKIIFNFWNKYFSDKGFVFLDDDAWLSVDIAKDVITGVFKDMEREIEYEQKKSELRKTLTHATKI